MPEKVYTEQDKQIQEMAADICRVKQNCNDVCNPVNSCMALKYAYRAYMAGYRKQINSEWVCDSRVVGYSETLINEHCANCGRKVTRTDKQPQVNYCPNCGAKMKGGAE